MANALIRYGLRFDSQPEVRLTVTATTETVTIPTDPAAVYFMQGDGAADDFLEILRQGFATHSVGATFALSLNASFQTVSTVSGAASAHQILLNDGATTLDPLLLGYATGVNSGSGGTLTSANVAGGLWLPGRPRANDSRDQSPLIRGSSKALSGERRTSYFATAKAERTVRFELMGRDRVLDEYRDSARPYSTAEHAWLNSIGRGLAFRLHDDEGGAGYAAYRYDGPDAPGAPYSRNGAYRQLWDSDLAVVAA